MLEMFHSGRTKNTEVFLPIDNTDDIDISHNRFARFRMCLKHYSTDDTDFNAVAFFASRFKIVGSPASDSAEVMLEDVYNAQCTII